MDLQRLQEFVIITHHGSIKKAAEALKIPSATLNSRLNSLEDFLGITLFERNSGNLTLTPKGSLFYKDASEIVAEYQEMKQAVSNPQKHIFHSLRIVIADEGMPFHLGPFLDILNAQNPQLQLELLDDTACSLTEGLLSGQVDLYFAPAMNQFSVDGIARYALSPSQQYVLLPSSHRLASRESVSLRELDRECFILYPETRETCIRDFQLANLRASGIRYSTYDSHSSVIFNRFFVPIGKGLIISPVPVIQEPPNSVCLPLTDVPYPAYTSLFYKKNCNKPETLQFVEAFQQFIRENQNHENRKTL